MFSRRSATASSRQGKLEAIQEQATVRQPGQGVVEGLVGQLLLELPALGDLAPQQRVRLGEPRGPLPDALVELGVRAP